MRTKVLAFLGIVFTSPLLAQTYDTTQLKTVAKIWGETYLFHPAVVQPDGRVEWERQLVEWLPNLHRDASPRELTALLNDSLLGCLSDPFTRVELPESVAQPAFGLAPTAAFDYLCIESADLESLDMLGLVDSLVVDRNSAKPLVLDLRIATKLEVDYHTFSPFHYLSSMLLIEPVTLSSTVAREHLGWDESNDWWCYEQHWRVARKDVDMPGSAKLRPYAEYAPQLSQQSPNVPKPTSEPIVRPLILITNNTFDAYYGDLVTDLRQGRQDTYTVHENSGPIIIPVNSQLKRYHLPNFDFILNTALQFSNAKCGRQIDFSSQALTQQQIEAFVAVDKRTLPDTRAPFSFSIEPPKYNGSTDQLTTEEKILGIIKIHTIIKYFHVDRDRLATSWDQSLGDYLDQAQKTTSDKGYFELVQRMMCPLQDSHVFVEHPSMMDFGALFVAPVMFDWVEGRAVVTSVAPELDSLIKVGDEIVAIDSVTIATVIEQKRATTSLSNESSLIAVAVTPANFTGAPETPVIFTIKKGKKLYTTTLTRSMHVFQLLMGGTAKGKLFELSGNNIGRLNAAYFQSPQQLHEVIPQIKATSALIIDMRNSYPNPTMYDLLAFFCSKPTVLRHDVVPVVSAASTSTLQSKTSWCYPTAAGAYGKPVAVLVDRTMMSRPEDIAMALKALDGMTFVGGQTQGTNGEMTKIYLPGGGSVSFTGQQVNYGDGTTFKGVGVMPDVEVEKTIKGVENGEDEILRRAIEILSKSLALPDKKY